MCKKTTGPTGGQWVGQWWVEPKGGIASVSLSRPLQTTGQHSGVQLFLNSQSFDPNLNCQLNGVGLYRLNSVRSNNRSHRPNRVILLIHWLSWSHAIVAFDAAADRLNSGSVQRMSAAFQQYVENRLLPQLRNNVTTGRLDERTTAKALTTCLNIT